MNKQIEYMNKLTSWILGSLLTVLIIIMLQVAYTLKKTEAALIKIEAKIPVLKVYSVAELKAMRDSFGQNAVNDALRCQSVFKVTGDVDAKIINDFTDPIPVEGNVFIER